MEPKKLTWRDELERHRVSAFSGKDPDQEIATKIMKEKYPGNYIVEEYFSSKSLAYDLRLKFETPEDEIMFLLKNE